MKKFVIFILLVIVIITLIFINLLNGAIWMCNKLGGESDNKLDCNLGKEINYRQMKNRESDIMRSNVILLGIYLLLLFLVFKNENK